MIFRCEDCGMLRGRKTCHTCELFEQKAKHQ